MEESLCTAMLMEWCDRGCLAGALTARTFPRVVQLHVDNARSAVPLNMKVPARPGSGPGLKWLSREWKG